MEHSPLQEQTETISRAIQRNIEVIVSLEEKFNQSRSLGDRIADITGGFAGSFAFILLHAVFFAGYVLINTRAIPGIRPFDQFPFLLLSVAVSMEAIFLSAFVLMKQNRMSKRADQRAHLDLQINLLAEREMTLVLQMLQRISTRLGVRNSGADIEELSAETSVEALASELLQKMPDDL